MGCGSSSTAVETVEKRSLSPPDSTVTGPGFLSREITTMTFLSEAERLGYPPPAPPVSRKSEIFQIRDYAAIDKRATKVPQSTLYGSYEDIAAHLTKGCKNDLAKVRALFRWVTSLDLSNLQSTLKKLPGSGTPLDYLLRIHWKMGNHAHFFAQLARAAGLPAVIITGMNKSAAYQLGGRMNKSAMGAQWNAVYLDGNWRLLDVFWASTCVIGRGSGEWSLVEADGDVQDDDDEDEEGETMHMVNEFFFLTDPDMLISTHFPDDELWQLLPEPMTLEGFEDRLFMRERFYDLGLFMLDSSHPQCLVQTKQGELQIAFGMPAHMGAHAQFKYVLFKAKQSADATSVPLERFVFYEKTRELTKYTIRFPTAGRFKMDVYGRNESVDDTYDLVCSYLIECADPKSDAQPLPDCPDIGWGPGVEAQKAGMAPKSHKHAVIDTKTGEVEIRFDMDSPKSVLQNVRSNLSLNEWMLNRHAVMKTEGGQLVLNMRLPEQGEYALKLFADDTDHEGELSNVCNYLIRCQGKNIQSNPYPKLHEGALGAGFLASTLGVDAVTHKGGTVSTSDGKISAKFVKQNGTELLCELHHNGVDKAELSQLIVSKDDGKATTFDVELPKKGEYAMNVFARRKGEKDRLYHVHTYLIDSQQAVEQVVKAGRPSVPNVVLPTSDDSVEVRVPVIGGPLMGELRKKNAQEVPKKGQMRGHRDGSQDVFSVDLPELGEYQLDVYEEKAPGAVEHMCTFYVVRHDPLPVETRAQSPVETNQSQEKVNIEDRERRRKEKDMEAKHKAFKQQLNEAIASQDVAMLQQAIKEFEARKVPDKGELKKAKQLLDYLTISHALSCAMSSHDLAALERAIAAAEKANMQKRLGLQLQMARKNVEQLKRVEKLKHDVLKLDQKTIAELKSYTQPPEAVHQVLASTFILLGESDGSVRDWRAVQVLLGKTGRQSFKRRVSEFNVEKLKMQQALKVKRMLKKYGASEVQGVSAGAATFYVWSMGMIEEAESRFIDGGGDLKHFQRRKTTQKGNS